MTGKKHKKESIKKMVKNRIGKCRGKDNPSWKGGTTPLLNKIKRLTEYKQWQKSVYERDNFTCRKCRQRGGNKTSHHLKAFSYLVALYEIKNVKEARECVGLWEVENGVTLCIPCHRETPNFSWKARECPIDDTVYPPIQKGGKN